MALNGVVAALQDKGQTLLPFWRALDELRYFGGIDGLCRKLDEDRTMQRISPRGTSP